MRICARDTEPVKRQAHHPSADGKFVTNHVLRFTIRWTALVDRTHWFMAFFERKVDARAFLTVNVVNDMLCLTIVNTLFRGGIMHPSCDCLQDYAFGCCYGLRHANSVITLEIAFLKFSVSVVRPLQRQASATLCFV